LCFAFLNHLFCTTPTMTQPCPLCQTAAPDDIIIATPQYRVVWANEAGYPCLARVVWNTHVAEMTLLSAVERNVLMGAVFAVELAMREVLTPAKINLASLGNWVPHLHWHVIPRFTDDAHWPNSTFAATSRAGVAHGESLKPALAAAIVQGIAALA
jgi:diadenosine tetraphosphate (Ap4A) HIT family hydrolase